MYIWNLIIFIDVQVSKYRKRIDVFMQKFSLRNGYWKSPHLIEDTRDTFNISAANYVESSES